VEGDYVVEPAEEARLLAAYYEAIRTEQPSAPQRNIDVPASLTTQEELLGRAGFAGVHRHNAVHHLDGDAAPGEEELHGQRRRGRTPP